MFEEAQDAPTNQERQLALARGGRLFDKWWVEGEIEFTPDDQGTEALDGKGGPQGNGTLPGADGEPMANSGHDYRLKNFFGWDLRGAEGIYGAKYHNKSYALPINLLTDDTSKSEWAIRLKNGFGGLPAYGPVLSEEQIGLVVDFIIAVRTAQIVGPGAAFELSEQAPKNYALTQGGNATRGHSFIQEKCAGCHGKDGTDIYMDDKFSLGMFGRMNAYEAWFKITSGQPGTKMGPQLSADMDGAGQGAQLKDIFAALCDRTLYPGGKAAAEDVADGDLRCGAYLK